MHYEADTHTHTYASGHAYNTIMEMVRAAADKGLKALAITDHTKGVPGHEMVGAPEDIYFRNYNVIPRKINGIHLLMGAEVNILNGGTVDLSERALKCLDIAIASIHGQCYDDEGVERNTENVLKVMEIPYIDILGHPDGSDWPLDYERIVAKAAETGTILELNENSYRQPRLRKNCKENALHYLALCKEMRVPVAIGSDAHFMDLVGAHEHNEPILEEADFPMDLVMNTSAEKLIRYLKSRKDRVK
ncbi:MAG: phosphatase [Anaerolineaceae bacterium]|nr:phosphatase [Anaerolineaceae bacterium]